MESQSRSGQPPRNVCATMTPGRPTSRAASKTADVFFLGNCFMTLSTSLMPAFSSPPLRPPWSMIESGKSTLRIEFLGAAASTGSSRWRGSRRRPTVTTALPCTSTQPVRESRCTKFLLRAGVCAALGTSPCWCIETHCAESKPTSQAESSRPLILSTSKTQPTSSVTRATNKERGDAPGAGAREGTPLPARRAGDRVLGRAEEVAAPARSPVRIRIRRSPPRR